MIPKQLSQQFNMVQSTPSFKPETREERHERIKKKLDIKKHGKGKRKRTNKKGGKK